MAAHDYLSAALASNSGVGTIESTGQLSQNGITKGTQHVTVDGALSAYVDESGNALEVKRAFASIPASSANESIVAAVATKKIRVLALFMLCGATATDITLQSNNTAISPLFANAANGGAVLPFNSFGWFETTAGQALKASTGAGSATGLLVLYVEA